MIDWSMMLPAVGGLAAVIWLYLLVGRGGFWLAAERDDRAVPPEPFHWPTVTAIVPARDEAEVVADSVGSLLAQNYPGRFHIILVDDQSSDGTADLARAAAGRLGCSDRLTVLQGQPLTTGWTGKLWAMCQGVQAAGTDPDYLLFTDADIAHDPDNLRRLVARATAGRLVLVSLMARLRCASWAERLMIPAFIFFFQMLYPFGWVNDPRRRMAGAAGGCMLARREALQAAGGIASIRDSIIDDCALGQRMKQQGPIWLGLGTGVLSLRPYDGMGEIRRMIARSAYAQLGYSPWLLLGCLLGMVLTYLTAPALALFGPGPVRWLGVVTWAAMAVSFQPILRFYRLSPLWGLALPAIAAIYTAFTLDSAIQHWQGRGGMWKGRAQAAGNNAA